MIDELNVSKKLIDYCVNPADLDKLSELAYTETRQILPYLSRIWIRDDSFDQTEYSDIKMAIFNKLRQFEDTNRICSYLNVDFNQIYEDVIRQLSARKKSQSLSVYSYEEFESASPTSKILMVSNILFNGNIRCEENLCCKYSSIDYSLFDFEIYFQDLSDLLCIVHAELGEFVSLSQFVFTLLHTQNPTNFMVNLVANSIDSLFQIVDIILEGCTCSQIDLQRHKCLLALSSLWPSLSSYIINECIRRHSLPSVILFLARQNNLIEILLGIFQFEHDRNWFVQFLRSMNKNVYEKQAVDLIREDLVTLCYEYKSKSHLDLQLFKLYSALRTFAGLKFNDTEIKSLMELILNTNEITVGVSFLLIYPPIYETEANHNRIIQWMKENFKRAQQSILLIATYCNSMQMRLLNDYVSNLIGFRIQLKTNSLNASRIFQQVFPDEILLNEYMRDLPVTPQLNAKLSQLVNASSQTSSGSMGIYFLNQWIKTSSFMNKRQFDLNKWLFEQIMQCVQPIHPVMLNLINNFVIQLFNLNMITDNRLAPLSSQQILEFFKNNYSDYDAHITPKILLFYYLLVYETKRRETLCNTLNTLQNPSNASANSIAVAAAMSNSTSKLISPSLEALLTFRYPVEVFEYIPINYFLLKAKESEFCIIYPSMLRFVINLFTQLCQVEHSLFEPQLDGHQKRFNLDFVLNKLVYIKCQIQSKELTRSEAHMFKEFWFKSYSIHGRKQSLKTASIMLNLPNLKYEEIYSNPLILLKSSEFEIYKCGPLFEILLYILKECLLAYKNQMEFFLTENHFAILNESKNTQFNQVKALKDRQELKNSLIAAQDTAVIQILLDLILLVKKNSNELEAREIQCIVCSFLHQMFIENSNLAELVHFQGYPRKLIPILVRGVPSMHICLEFAPKLLAHNDLNKQVNLNSSYNLLSYFWELFEILKKNKIFGINLIAHLCDKYPIVRTFNVAKLAINVIFTVLQAQTIDERRKFFKEISSALVIFYSKLPPLTHECMSLISNALQTKTISVEDLPELIVPEL